MSTSYNCPVNGFDALLTFKAFFVFCVSGILRDSFNWLRKLSCRYFYIQEVHTKISLVGGVKMWLNQCKQRQLCFLGRILRKVAPVQTPYLSCAVPNTFLLQGRPRRRALPYPEILPCVIDFCRKKLIWTPFHCQITTYYLVRYMRGTASELGLRQRADQ